MVNSEWRVVDEKRGASAELGTSRLPFRMEALCRELDCQPSDPLDFVEEGN